MEFSLWNFKEWYEKHNIDLSYMILDNTATISMLSTTNRATDSRLDCALIQPGETLSDCSGFHTVLSHGRDRILFPVASTMQVHDIGSAMIEHYSIWENNLLDRIAQGCSAEELLLHGRSCFPFPCAFFLPEGTILYQTPDWPNELHHLLQSLDCSRLKDTRDKAQFHTLFGYQSQTVLSEMLYSQDTSLGLLVACEGQGKFQPGDLHIFHTLALAIKSAFCFRPDALTSFHPMASWFSKAIASPAKYMQEPTSLLQQSHWIKNDYYAIASVLLNDPSMAFSSQIATMTDNNHCCVPTSSGFSILIHQNNIDLQKEIQRLKYCCPASSCVIGISLPFQSLSDAYWYYQQSLWAAKEAKVRKQHLCNIRDFHSSAIRQAGQNIPQAQALIHPAILQLAQKSSVSGEPLLDTLFMFLICGCSISQTANALSVHRNTLRTRIKAIESCIPTSWDNPDLREQYILSLMLFREKNAKHHAF